MNKQQRQQLIDATLTARGMAHAPYSEFLVGAAVLAASGRIFCGCNIENASYGLTLCAERVAIASAVASGEREFIGLAVATNGGASPCGACRQFAAEFRHDLPILIIDTERADAVREASLADLLPEQFHFRERQ